MTKDEAAKVAQAVIEAYQDVVKAPDESLSPEDAWNMAASYVAEFTMRQLFFKGLIHRKIAVLVFEVTGGCEDWAAWTLKEKPTICPLCNGPATKSNNGLSPNIVFSESSCEECGIYYCTWCERWRGWTLGAHDNMPDACDNCWMPDPVKEVRAND